MQPLDGLRHSLAGPGMLLLPTRGQPVPDVLKGAQPLDADVDALGATIPQPDQHPLPEKALTYLLAMAKFLSATSLQVV